MGLTDTIPDAEGYAHIASYRVDGAIAARYRQLDGELSHGADKVSVSSGPGSDGIHPGGNRMRPSASHQRKLEGTKQASSRNAPVAQVGRC